ncbi:ATP-binding protein [Pedobacter insulae]|uniref:ATP-binding protein n=1 Tax=Pedobacter insulae TaxID=414048 RepID=UPI0015A4FB0A|nr:ATP-binding protein [Pedobacter insulae]
MDIDKISFNIILLILIVALIFYNLWKIYQNENDLVISNDKAAEFAVAKTRFLTTMSHEIRTPLNSVIGFSEQLSQSALSKDQAAQLTAIRSSSAMVLDLVNDILDFSKYEAYRVNLEIAPFSLMDCISEVVHIMAIQAVQKGIELKTDISFGKDFCVVGDTLRLKQLVMNLLSNAIKFTERGSVKLKADVKLTKGNQLILKAWIIDTGIGIDEVNLGRIFDEFAQVNYLPSQFRHKGTGLGLAICKKIVEFQNGEINVVSELDKGSIFSFSIPYEICDNKISAVESPPTIDLATLVGKRILLVDDNIMNILLAQTVISKHQLFADVAYNGQEALALFEQNQYDLILTDIEMPIVNGVVLSKAIRSCSDAVKRNTPILGVTAHLLAEDRLLYKSAGMNDLISKPFSEKELMDKIALQFT